MHYKGNTQMGIGKKMGLSLVLLKITSLCLLASSTTVLDDKPFLPDLLQENNLGATGTHGHGISSIDDDSNERSSIVHSSKFAHGSSAHGGARGGGAADNANGGGGAADNANGGGGGAVVPVIVAGAAINHRPNNHHNAGSRHTNCMVLPTLITATLVALVVH